MKPCLVDVNVLLPLLVKHHEHHWPARKWFDSLNTGEAGVCRVVQLALARLLNNRSVMGRHVTTASDAWRLIGELLEDSRMEFVMEPKLVDTVLPKLFRYTVPTPKLIMDAYLAAFAIADERRLATFDRGFHQFSDLTVDLLLG